MDNMEDLDNIIVLNDEDGNPVEFEFVDLIKHGGHEYVILLPIEDEDSDEVVILKIKPSDNEEEETYVSVDDEEELSTIFEIFKEKFKDEFTFDE